MAVNNIHEIKTLSEYKKP